jgi:LDH2 family malate/lactate/ureidoglycolate dehydrogenase
MKGDNALGDQILVEHARLRRFTELLYCSAGLSTEDAAICAECTIKTNLWGVDSHGVLRTPAYIQRILKKAVNPSPKLAYLSAADGPLSLMDGDAGMGYVVGTKAMRETIGKAAKFGMGAILVKNSNHFGAASLFARMAAEKGMIGMATTNVKPNIGMPGAKKPVTGNNPLALAAPLPGPFPFSLDISMSAVAGGKLLLAQKKGEKIPTTWALDPDGNETDDPFKAFAGILLPMGMHKGLGLSLFIDILTGVLGGGPFLQDMKSMYQQADEPSETSHFFCAIDASLFLPDGEFGRRMAAWVEMIKSTPMVDPSSHQIIPGEIEHLTETKRKAEGVPLPPDLVKELVALGERFGLNERLTGDHL